MSIFTEDAGRFLPSHESEAMTGAYRTRKVSVGLTDEEYVRSEYFGINQVQQLLAQPGCTGLRIHHAKRWEDADGKPTKEGQGQLKPRVLLTAVDASGRDIISRLEHTGLKDDENGDVQTVGDGYTCPRHCPK